MGTPSAPELMVILSIFVIWFVPLIFIYKIAKKKDREAIVHVLVGILTFPLFWLIVISLLKEKNKTL